MAAEPQAGVWEALLAFASKMLPATVGAAISLKFLPEGATKVQAAFTLLGGVSTAAFAGPAVAELVSASPSIAAVLNFAIGLFGLAVIGQLWAAIRDVQAGSILKDAIRKFLGLGG